MRIKCSYMKQHFRKCNIYSPSHKLQMNYYSRLASDEITQYLDIEITVITVTQFKITFNDQLANNNSIYSIIYRNSTPIALDELSISP